MATETIVLVVGLLVLATAITIALLVRTGQVDSSGPSLPKLRPGLLQPDDYGTHPAGVLPGMVGAIQGGEVHGSDVAITIVDLATRGYLVLTPLRDSTVGELHDWVITRTAKPSDDLLAYERTLTDTAFTNIDGSPRAAVALSRLQLDERRLVRRSQDQLIDALEDHGWKNLEDRPHSRWGWIGSILLLIGLVVSVFMVFDWIAHRSSGGVIGGVAITAAGIVLASLGRGRELPEKIQKEAAKLDEYREYLDHFDASTLDAKSAEQTFSKHLPWTIQLRSTEQFGKTFDALLARARSWGQYVSFELPWLKASEEFTPSEIVTAMTNLVTATSRPNK